VEFVRGMTSLAAAPGPVVMHYWTFQLPLFYAAAALLVLPAWWLLRNYLHRGARRNEVPADGDTGTQLAKN
jgi:hypothetical protein